jgi:M6 family metalloprotease-like protein
MGASPRIVVAARRIGAVLAAMVFVGLQVSPAHALMPPARGNTKGLPAKTREAIRRDPSLFYPRKGFKNVIARQKARRALERSRLMRLGMTSQAADAQAAQSTAVTRFCPVLCGIYADKPSPDWPASDLNDELFDSNYSQNNPYGDPGSMREKYRDMSYGTFDLQGGVFGWFRVPQPGPYYYSDDNGTGTDRATGETGAFIRHTLQAADPTIDFRPYDNDGPDGVPNSGDDDGIVDLVMFVHPNQGGECGGDDIWSHSFHYSGWPENPQPFVTDDIGANGQPLRVDDYVIMPAMACGGARRIETGVFAHEFGHALGLPDLYDRTAIDDPAGTGYVSSGGMGLYCLMAAGSYGGDYDHPAYSVNMCAWSKEQLGWIQPREVTCDGPVTLYFQGEAPEALKLWRGGDYSGREYFLAENRQKKKWDLYLQGEGLLVTHVDNGVLTQNDDPCPGGNPCLNGHYLVGVVEADAQWEMQAVAAPVMGPWFGESEDFFRGGGKDSLTDLSAPSSRGHDGSLTGVRISSISASGQKMTANVSVGLACTATPSLVVDHVAVQGGCDLDGYPDPGEAVDLAVTLRNLPGGATARNLQGTLTSLTPAWITVLGPTASFPRIDGGHNGETIVPFRVGVPVGAPCGAEGRLRLDLTADGYAVSREVRVRVRVDSSFVAIDPFTDTIESGGDNGWHHYAFVYLDDWTRSNNGNHTTGALPGTSWFTPAPPTGKDASLEPPAFVPTATSQLSYWHRYDTEDNWDGYVLELTADGGATWQDVGDQTNIRYDDSVMVNPQSTISGRRCWNGLNAGFPQFENVTLSLGSWAGQAVRVRFRLATDMASTGVTPLAGVNIDDLTITGATVLRETCEQLAVCNNTDHAAPVFAGLSEAVNPGLPSCDAIDLKWFAASDASGPVRYLVYASRTLPVPLDAPVASTQALRTRISGLDYGAWHFVVRARDSQGNVDANQVTRSAELACDPPSLVVRSQSLSELQGCDADGRPDAGEYLDLALVLQNDGRSNARHVQARLRSLSSFVGTQPDPVSFPDLALAHDEAGASPFQLWVSANTPCMTPATLELDVTADGGYHEVRTIQLMLESDQVGTQVTCDAASACNPVSVQGGGSEVTRLQGPHPSPARGATSLLYAIGPRDAGRVAVRVYDVAGRVIRTLFDGDRGAGRYRADWNGSNGRGEPVRGGIYFVRLEAGGQRLTQRVVMLR